MEGLAGTAELVVLPMEEAEPGGDAPVHEGGVHLQALLQGAAVVLVGVDEQGGRLHVLCVLQGRLGPEGGGPMSDTPQKLSQLEMDRWEAQAQNRSVWPMIQLVMKPP